MVNLNMKEYTKLMPRLTYDTKFSLLQDANVTVMDMVMETITEKDYGVLLELFGEIKTTL